MGERSKGLSTSIELLLYSVPSSISVPEQEDVVRRAIVKSRERLQEKGVEMVPNGGLVGIPNGASPVGISIYRSSGLSSGGFRRGGRSGSRCS